MKYDALRVAAKEKNANIFVLLLDCFEAMHSLISSSASMANDNRFFKITFQYDNKLRVQQSNWIGVYSQHTNEGVVKRLLMNQEETNEDNLSWKFNSSGKCYDSFLGFVNQGNIGKRRIGKLVMCFRNDDDETSKLTLVLEFFKNTNNEE